LSLNTALNVTSIPRFSVSADLITCLFIFVNFVSFWAHVVAQLVEALYYKPAGRGFLSRWCHSNFFSHNTSGPTKDLGSTQPLTEMSKVNLNESHYRPEVPRDFQEVKVPRLRDNGPEWW